MDLDSLKQYVNWIGKSPEKILREVKNHGGWRKVFPNNLPLWAHRIRNYFNVEPTLLTRLDPSIAKPYLQKISHDVDLLQSYKKVKLLKNHPVWGLMPEVKMLPNPPAGTPSYRVDVLGNIRDEVAEDKALSEYVYKDSGGAIWYQMSPGGAIYHFKKPRIPALESPLQTILTQAFTPVFKLISPDGSGGSSETIIRNEFRQPIPMIGRTYRAGRFAIGDVNRPTPMKLLIVRDNPILLDVFKVSYQGSYNYSETVIAGMAAHSNHDVEPHERHHTPGSSGFYIDPPDRHAPLAARQFPSHHKGVFIASQYQPA